MSWFDHSQPYDRSRILEAAAQARARKKRKLAIRLYRRVLAVERHDAELHARIAPLLAETGQPFDAWLSYRIAARACLREGRGERALGIYREAAARLPREIQVWQSIARLEFKLGRQRDAVDTLIEGPPSSARAGTGPRPSSCCGAPTAWRPGTSRRSSSSCACW
ncbi:MAG: tetratricopeptide repeat protein [Myxococcota bacterium]